MSQGTFGKRILRLISKDPDEDARLIKRGEKLTDDARCIFREYFIEDKDDVIMKILLNCFNALKKVFPDEWMRPKEYILWKTTGFNAVIDSLPVIYKYGTDRKDLTAGLFENVFNQFKGIIEEKHIRLTSEHFGSGESETKKLKDLICEAVKKQAESETL